MAPTFANKPLVGKTRTYSLGKLNGRQVLCRHHGAAHRPPANSLSGGLRCAGWKWEGIRARYMAGGMLKTR
jgi:hypothetical protein